MGLDEGEPDDPAPCLGHQPDSGRCGINHLAFRQLVNPVDRVGVIGSPCPTPTSRASSAAMRRTDARVWVWLRLNAVQPVQRLGHVASVSPVIRKLRSGQ